MTNFKKLTKSGNRFLFRGKKYKFLSYCPIPSVEMISEDGEILSFGIDAPIGDEFILCDDTEIP